MTKSYDELPDSELVAEHAKFMDALDHLTSWRGAEAFMLANSARKAYQELVDRGQGHLIEGYRPRAGDPLPVAGAKEPTN